MTKHTNTTIRHLLHEGWRPNSRERNELERNISTNRALWPGQGAFLYTGHNEYYFIGDYYRRRHLFRAIAEEASKLGLSMERVKKFDYEHVLGEPFPTDDWVSETQLLVRAFQLGQLWRIFKA